MCHPNQDLNIQFDPLPTVFPAAVYAPSNVCDLTVLEIAWYRAIAHPAAWQRL